MRARLFAVAWLLVLVPSLAFAKDTPWDKSGIDWTRVPSPGEERSFAPPQPQRFELSNGIDVWVIERHTLPIVSVRVIVAGAGSASDGAGKRGLAALTADLLDEGAGGSSAIEIAEEIDRMGSSLSVWADLDAGHVSATSLARKLDRTVEIVSKVITAPAFDAKEFERVFGDVKTELVLRRDEAPSLAALVSAAVVFGPDAPYGHPPAGLLEDVEKLTLDDVRAFFGATWSPAATTIVVAGDVDPVALIPMLDKHLGGWKAAGATAPARIAKPKPAPFVRFAVSDRPGSAQTQLAIGMRGVPRTDPRYHAIELYTTVLGGSFTSRLVQRLREQLGYTYGIRAVMRYLSTSGMFAIRSGVFTPKTGESLVEIRKILDDLARKDVPPAELDKGKKLLILQLPEQFDTNAEVASEFAELALYGLPPNWFDGFAAAVSKVTAKDLRKLAKSMFVEKKMSYVLVGDLAKIEPDLKKLKLGKPRRYDADGKPIAPAKGGKGK